MLQEEHKGSKMALEHMWYHKSGFWVQWQEIRSERWPGIHSSCSIEKRLEGSNDRSRVRVEVTEIVQMRCASSLEKGACVHAKVLQLCQTLRHCGLVPARLLCPWGSPGKNTGVGCHALLQVHKDGSSATGESDQTLNIF